MDKMWQERGVPNIPKDSPPEAIATLKLIFFGTAKLGFDMVMSAMDQSKSSDEFLNFVMEVEFEMTEFDEKEFERLSKTDKVS